MTNWYRAYCALHRETCTVFVCSSSSGVGAVYPDDAHRAAWRFLTDHYDCHLELLRDDQAEVMPTDTVDKTPP